MSWMADMLPWTALEWIIHNFEDGAKILEIGSGYGSGVLSTFFDVTAIEHDSEWMGRFPGVRYVHAPISMGWYRIAKGSIPTSYDLLIIDGPPSAVGARNGILSCLELFDWEATVLIDDLNRQDIRLLARDLCGETGIQTIYSESDGSREFGVYRR